MTPTHPALRRALPALALLAAWLALFAPILWGGRVLFWGDFALYFVPELDFLRHNLRSGALPLWNPYLLCGVPFSGNPQAWPLYPSNALLWLTSAERAGTWMGALHCLWGGLGMLAFLRREGRSGAGALIGALAFGLGGAIVSKMQFPNMAQAMAWLPWLLLATDRCLAAPTPRRLAALALTLALAVLAAHPQMTLFQLYLIVAWVAWSRPKRATIVRLLMAGALAGLLASAYLLPVVEAARDSLRPALGLDKANRFILPPYDILAAFALPRAFGDPAVAPPWIGRGNFWEPCAYAGALPFVLALWALATRGREAAVRFWGVALALSVWLAVGRSGGLFTVAFYVLPGLSKFHDPARFLHLATFAAAWLAARGADAALDGERRRALWATAFAIAASVELVAFDRTLHPTVPARLYDEVRVDLARRLAGAERIWHADEKPVWRSFVHYPDYAALSTDDGAREFLLSGAPNLPLLARVRDAGGYEPVRPARFEPLRRALEDRKSAAATERALAVTDRLRWSGVSGLSRVAVSGEAPRAYVTLASGARIAQRVRDLSPNRVEIVATGHAGVVTLCDSAAPGWRVFVDGVEGTPRGDGALRQVDAPEGAARVVWVYAPTAWRLGWFLTCLGACILGVLWHGRSDH